MEEKKKTKKQLPKFIQFSGMGLQIGLIIYLGSILGKWLDEKYANTGELYFKICTLASVFLAMYNVIRQVQNLSDKD
jgi:F0F1-type ATP synthase assembly protein I